MTATALQLELFREPLKTVCISPSKDMPEDVFVTLDRLAVFTECMERMPDGRILWDESLVTMYSEGTSHAFYEAVQRDWINLTWELPEPVVQQLAGGRP